MNMDAEEIRQLVDRYIAAYNTFDVDGMLAVLHPEIEFRSAAFQKWAMVRG